MALNFRLMKHPDLPWCAERTDDGFENRPDLTKALPKVWGGWKQSGSSIMAVLEDDELPAPQIVTFATTVFLTAEFTQEVLARPAPHLAIRVVERELQGRSAVLGLDAIRHGNAARDLNLCILHYTETFDYSYPAPAQRGCRNKMMQGLLETHSGFGLQQVVLEVFGEHVLRYALASGLQLRADYSDYYERTKTPPPVARRRPHLIGLRKAEATQSWGTTFSMLFDPAPPEFHFSKIQQDVLWIALFEQDNDEWIGKRLGIASHTIKWRWLTMFETVEQVKPNLFAALDEAVPRGSRSDDQPRRGREKRRLLSCTTSASTLKNCNPSRPNRRRQNTAGGHRDPAFTFFDSEMPDDCRYKSLGSALARYINH